MSSLADRPPRGAPRSRARAAVRRRPRGTRTAAGARAHASAPQREQRDARSSASAAAIAFSCLASSHMGAPQDFDAQVGERACPPAFAAIGTSEWPVMPGDVFTSRNWNVPSGCRMRSSRPQPRAADDAERGERRRADLPLLRLGRARRDRSTSSRRRNTCCDSRSCRRGASMRISGSARSPRIDAVSSTPGDELLDQHEVVVLAPPRRRRARARRGRRSTTFVMPIVEPSRAGFTISGRPSSATTRIQSVARVDDAVARRRDAAREPDELGAPLVHRERGGHHAAARVADAQRLERALHGAVLAEAAVQRDEHARRSRRGASSHSVALRRVERVRVDALVAQRGQHGVAGQERDLALRRRARPSAPRPCRIRSWLIARPPFAATPTMRTSGSRSTPVRCADRRRARARSALRCRRRFAAPSGLTMKFACFSDTRAPPIGVALEAAALDQARRVVARRIAEHAAALGSRAAASRCAGAAAP